MGFLLWLLLAYRRKSKADSVYICCSISLSFTLYFNNQNSAKLFQTEVIKSKISQFAKKRITAFQYETNTLFTSLFISFCSPKTIYIYDLLPETVSLNKQLKVTLFHLSTTLTYCNYCHETRTKVMNCDTKARERCGNPLFLERTAI